MKKRQDSILFPLEHFLRTNEGRMPEEQHKELVNIYEEMDEKAATLRRDYDKAEGQIRELKLDMMRLEYRSGMGV